MLGQLGAIGSRSALCSALLFRHAAAPALRAALPPPAGCGAWAGVRFATSKAGGSTKNGRDSNPKYLGVKKFGGEWVDAGNIIVRQRGAKYGIVESTKTVGMGRDHTVYALQPGYVRFWWHAMRRKYFIEVVKSPPTEKEVRQACVCGGGGAGGAPPTGRGP